MVLCFLSVLVGNVEIHMVHTIFLHLAIDGTRHNVARSQRPTLVILVHEGCSVGQFQYAAVATHGLGDEVSGMGLAGVVERCGVKLHKLHILHRSLGAVNHGLTVARGHHRVGGCLVHGATSARAHHGNLAQVGVYPVLCVEHIGAIAVNEWRATGYPRTQVVLRNDLHGEVVLLDVNIGIGAHSGHQGALNLSSRVVGMVQYAELRVSSLTVKVKLAIGLLVELRSPLHQLADLFGRFCHHLTHSRRVADVVAGNHGVVDVFFKIVFLKVGHRRHATLREARIGLIERCFADDANLSFFRLGHFQGVAHACYTGANDQKVVLVSHNECVMSVQNY